MKSGRKMTQEDHRRITEACDSLIAVEGAYRDAVARQLVKDRQLTTAVLCEMATRVERALKLSRRLAARSTRRPARKRGES